MTETVDQGGAVQEQSRRKYTRRQMLGAAGLALALGVGISLVGTKIVNTLRGNRAPVTVAPLDPSVVAHELGDKCLKLHGQPSKLTPSEEEKRFGKGSSCTVYWTRGELSGVSVTDGESPQAGVVTYSVYKPQNETPSTWTWEINGTTPTKQFASILVQTAPNGLDAGYNVYGSGCDPNTCPVDSAVGQSYIPGTRSVDYGLLTNIAYICNHMLDHPNKPSY